MSHRRRPSAGAAGAQRLRPASEPTRASLGTTHARRALASLAVFEALQPAGAGTTGVHMRRVHYLYRDPAKAPCKVRLCALSRVTCRCADARAALTHNAAAAVDARSARLQVRARSAAACALRRGWLECADACASPPERTTCRRKRAPASAPATATWRPWCVRVAPLLVRRAAA